MMDEGPTREERNGKSILPGREFMFTLDQVAGLFNIEIEALPKYVFFMGAHINRVQPADGMKAVSITPSHMHERPEWRIPETEVTRYMRRMGLVIYERKYRPE